MKKPHILCLVISIFFFFSACTTTTPVSDSIREPNTQIEANHETALFFEEIWSYVLDGRENTLSNDMPLTDVGYFGAEISNRGFLTGVPDARKIDYFEGRIHLVAVCNHYGMTHMMLNPDYPFRDQLINDLISAVVEYNYDGLQIDYELILASDEDNYISFLQELNNRLKQLPATSKTQKRIFSVALPARTKYLSEDAFDYERVTEIADKVFVMAYDEHWSGGSPGPVASFSWGENVAEYALQTIGKEKLIMGQPFYGRTWGNINGNRAFFHSGMMRQVIDNNVENLERNENILTFSYTIPLTITGYFDDADSIEARSRMYHTMNIDKTGFWCLGQEDPEVWQRLMIKQEN